MDGEIGPHYYEQISTTQPFSTPNEYYSSNWKWLFRLVFVASVFYLVVGISLMKRFDEGLLVALSSKRWKNQQETQNSQKKNEKIIQLQQQIAILKSQAKSHVLLPFLIVYYFSKGKRK